jgi:hypothetical protein
MEGIGKGLKPGLLEPLLCISSLISDLIFVALKYLHDRIIRIPHSELEILMPVREILGTIDNI